MKLVSGNTISHFHQTLISTISLHTNTIIWTPFIFLSSHISRRKSFSLITKLQILETVNELKAQHNDTNQLGIV